MEQAIAATIGLDLGDRFTEFCVVAQESGAMLQQGRVATTRAALGRLLTDEQRARVVMEVGTHSPWISRLAAEAGHEVLVANARNLRFIYAGTRKSDQVDARVLAKVGRLDPGLLYPITHRSLDAQLDLAQLRARDGLVSARTKLVNTLRGLLKSLGERLPKCAAKSIGIRTLERIPAGLHEVLRPLLLAIEGLSDEIHAYDTRIEQLARDRYPETRCLSQVPGVGDLTALAFVLTVEHPERFDSPRRVGAFLGLVPRRDQSGETDKHLRITRTGDRAVRTLLVQCAHYILGRNGPDSDLKRWGLKLAERGGVAGKKRAVIAVARKLAVLLTVLWQRGEVYEPIRDAARAA